MSEDVIQLREVFGRQNTALHEITSVCVSTKTFERSPRRLRYIEHASSYELLEKENFKRG